METYLAIPDVGTFWSLKNKTIVGVEIASFLVHLNSTCVQLISAWGYIYRRGCELL